MRQINVELDSLKKVPDSMAKKIRTDLSHYVTYTQLKNPLSPQKQPASAKSSHLIGQATSFNEVIPDSLKFLINDQALNSVSNVKSMLEIASADYKDRTNDITQHKIEWHKKLSLSIACLVLFFIGAPLGSIIRKGGLGMPLVMALLFFMIFYLLNIFGEKFTKDNVLYPIIGMWLPVIVLTPVGFFLTYKAMHDSQLFNKEYYYRAFKNIRIYIKRVASSNKPVKD
jgi:lipopolysaccharide export system permease protein